MPSTADGRTERPEPPACEPGPERIDGVRLQKVLARSGIGSRRVSEDLIAGGRVRVNGEVADLGRRVDPDRDVVEVDAVPIGTAQGLAYLLLHKPRGVISTASDPEGRRTVVDLVPPEPRVVPVGRLDADSEGLLLLTNDGVLAHRLTHPSFGVDKEYLVEVQGRPAASAVTRLRRGVELGDGVTAPAKVAVLGASLLRITIHEGRNRQIRRMCEAVGHPVVRLVRSRIGPVTDRSLESGRWRVLAQAEVRALERAATAATAASPRRRPSRSGDDVQT